MWSDQETHDLLRGFWGSENTLTPDVHLFDVSIVTQSEELLEMILEAVVLIDFNVAACKNPYSERRDQSQM